MPQIKPGQIWLVIYECRVDAVRISLSGDGFFAPGQEVLWSLSAVQQWLHCAYDPHCDQDERFALEGIKGENGKTAGKRTSSWWMRR